MLPFQNQVLKKLGEKDIKRQEAIYGTFTGDQINSL